MKQLCCPLWRSTFSLFHPQVSFTDATYPTDFLCPSPTISYFLSLPFPDWFSLGTFVGREQNGGSSVAATHSFCQILIRKLVSPATLRICPFAVKWFIFNWNRWRGNPYRTWKRLNPLSIALDTSIILLGQIGRPNGNLFWIQMSLYYTVWGKIRDNAKIILCIFCALYLKNTLVFMV